MAKIYTYLAAALLCQCMLIEKTFAEPAVALDVTKVKAQLVAAAALKSEPLQTGISLEQNSEFAAAIIHYKDLVTQIKQTQGEYTEQLIEPLTGLARSYKAVGEYDLAIATIRHAQHLHHRFEGVLTLSQLEAIELLIDISLEQNLPELSDKQQVFGLSLAERNFADQPLAVLPALEKITQWYRDTGQLNKARQSLSKSIDIISTNKGENNADLIPYLITKAEVIGLQRMCCSQDSLKRALEIAELKSPELANKQSLTAPLYVEIADSYTVVDKRKKAAIFYKLAWDSMSPAQRRVNFATPKTIVLSKEIIGFPLFKSLFESSKRDTFKQAAINDLRHTFNQGAIKDLTKKEQFIFERLPPQEFFVVSPERNYNLRIQDTYYPHLHNIEHIKVVGSPFQFVRDQIEYVLPAKWGIDDRIAQIELDLQFTVRKSGILRDIEVSSSNSPNRIKQLMRDVLLATRMRPRLVDGLPVDTEQVTLSQTFK